MNPAWWDGRSVFVTGHTGFKGSWLALWLHSMGARVHGYSLDPDTEPNLFEVAGIDRALASDTRADLADVGRVRRSLQEAQPSVVLHLAAQPLVRESYREPLATLSTNILGTAHVLEAVRDCPTVESVVIVTTDKVYANADEGRPFSEGDPLGGMDPYSASKAAAELVVATYRHSFLAEIPVASARAGNVIGGGDWSHERLLPDCLAAFASNDAIALRAPDSVRPWQHVLDPVAGYLLLAQRLAEPDGIRFAQAWNFGPDPRDEATVLDVAERTAALWGSGDVVVDSGGHPHEAGYLTLDSSSARSELGWSPVWHLDAALERTVDWEKARRAGQDMWQFSVSQLRDHLDAAGGAG